MVAGSTARIDEQNSYSPCDPSGSLDAEQLSRLTAEHVADRGESAVADGFGPVVLHDAEIDQRNADRFGVCSVWLNRDVGSIIVEVSRTESKYLD